MNQELHTRISKVQSTNPYFGKDLAKAAKSNKFIGWGSPQSSTRKYAIAAGDLGNTGKYESTDIVFISAEGNRSSRIAPEFTEIKLATDARATFVTDDFNNRSRSYNIGEREVAAFLSMQGYVETRPGTWSFQP